MDTTPQAERKVKESPRRIAPSLRPDPKFMLAYALGCPAAVEILSFWKAEHSLRDVVRMVSPEVLAKFRQHITTFGYPRQAD